MMKKRVITWTLLVALTVAVPAFGIFGIPSPEDLLIWFVLRPIMHGNQRAMIANQLEQLRQLVEQLQTARSQLTHVTDSVQGLVGPIADPMADLVAAPTDLLHTTRDWHSDFTGPAGDMVTSLRDLTANGESFSRSWRDVLQEADTVTEADIRHVYPGSADAAVAVFQRRRDYADRSLEYAGARADAGADLVAGPPGHHRGPGPHRGAGGYGPRYRRTEPLIGGAHRGRCSRLARANPHPDRSWTQPRRSRNPGRGGSFSSRGTPAGVCGAATG